MSRSQGLPESCLPSLCCPSRVQGCLLLCSAQTRCCQHVRELQEHLTQGGLLVKFVHRFEDARSSLTESLNTHPYGRLCSSEGFRVCLGYWRRSRQLERSFQGRRTGQVASSGCCSGVWERQCVAFELRGAFGGRSLPFEGVRHVEALAQQRLGPPLLAGADRPLEGPSLDIRIDAMSGKLRA